MQIRVSTLRSLPKPGYYTFNVFVQLPEGGEFLLNGFRIINGKIYPPAVKYGANKFFNAVLLSADFCSEIYLEISGRVKAGELLTIKDAVKPMTITESAVNMFMPELLAELQPE